MNKNLERAFAAAVVTFGLSGAAQADPFYFDFTGTIQGLSIPQVDGATAGLAISGGFNFDTERLYRTESPGTTTVAFVDWQPTGLTEPLAFLSFGTRDVTIPAYGGSNYSAIFFNDYCIAASCPQSDNFSLFAYTSSQPDPALPADFTGTYNTASVFLLPGIFAPNNMEFDYTTVDPTAIVTLPANGSLGVYYEDLVNCVAGACTTVESRQFSFSVDTVTRGMGPREVPEPGTLVLLLAGLAGLFLVRRRFAVDQAGVIATFPA